MDRADNAGGGDMSINEALRGAVRPIVPICVPDLYGGEEKEYCTFNYTEIPAIPGDDEAEAVIYLVQLHWFLPHGINPLKKKKQIRNALIEAEFTPPQIVPATDEDGQHYVFECQWTGGAD